MINILIGFLPWILLKIISVFSLSWAIIISSITCLLYYPKLRKGFILEWGTVLFFLIALVLVVLLKHPWFAFHMSVWSSVTLATIAWFSLLINLPFTLQYAKLTVPKDSWNSPLFLRINKIMTASFGVIFSLNCIWNVYELYNPKVDAPFVSWAVFGFNIGLISWFVSWFPNWYKKRSLK